MIPGFLAKVENMACLVPGLLGVHHLRADYIGPDKIHSGMHIVVQRGSSPDERIQNWTPFKRRQIKQMEEERP